MNQEEAGGNFRGITTVVYLGTVSYYTCVYICQDH